MRGGGGGRPRLPLLRASIVISVTLIHCLACRKGGGGGSNFVVHGWSVTTTYHRAIRLCRFPPQRQRQPSPTTIHSIHTHVNIFDGRPAHRTSSLAFGTGPLVLLDPRCDKNNTRRRIVLASTAATSSADDAADESTMTQDDGASAARQDKSSSNDHDVNSSPNQLLDLPSRKLKCRYFALRHGQSEANVQGLIASNPDVACAKYGLSPLGLQQAVKAGHDVVEYYRKHLVTSDAEEEGAARIVILTSDLLRAKQTAETVRDAVLAALGASILFEGDVIVETRLRERGFGNWDLTSDDNYKRVWDDDAIDSSHTNNSVESVDSVMRRVTSAIAEWDSKLCGEEGEATDAASSAAAHPPTMVICVAHGDVLQILQTAFEKMDGTLHRTLPHLETATLRPLILKED